jgi:hypothetical protein
MSQAEVRTPIQSRDIRFDILKVIGLFCIILAHVSPPSLIFQLRNFDVPLMVMISGSVFYLSSFKKNNSLGSYLKKRLIRLIAPVWIFLVTFFLLIDILFTLNQEAYPFSLGTIIGAFLLSEGAGAANESAGFVYIIRVFILTALISPSILSLYKTLKYKEKFLGLLAIVYIFYELTVHYIDDIHFILPGLENFLRNYVLISIPYGCLVGLGIVFTQTSRAFLVKTALFFLGIFLVLAGYFFATSGKLIMTQIAKYPPTIYYLSYAIFVSILAYLVVDQTLKKHGENWFAKSSLWTQIIVFISQSSLWIYLWQSFWVIFWGLFPAKHFPFANHFIVAFVGITFLSILTTYLQKRFFTKMIETGFWGRRYQQVATILFLQ